MYPAVLSSMTYRQNTAYQFGSLPPELPRLQRKPVGRQRKPTVLIKVAPRVSLSRRAFLLGLSLALLQISDGLLTYSGLSLFGVHMEGNVLLRSLMLQSGSVAGPLFAVKIYALLLVALLTFQAHSRRWIRPLLGLCSGIFFLFAVLPWSLLILHATV